MGANWSSNEPCVCCGLQDEQRVCFHHLLTRKTYAEYQDEKWNKIPVCQPAHNLFHSKGPGWMADNFPNVERWLIKNGWFRADQHVKQRKWMPPIWAQD
jgi:hypothetical protein